MTTARRLRISGRVQGVGFRHALQREARSLGLVGWVRNRRDGTVEALVQGDPASLDAIVAWARRGPPASRVDRVDARADAGLPAPAGFDQLPTE